MLYASTYMPSTPYNAYFYLFLYISIISVNILVIFGDKNAEKRLSLEKELADLRYKENLTDALVEQQGYYIEELNGLRHDFKRQLSGLHMLSTINKLDGKYLDELSEAVSCIQTFSYIKSLPLRVIVNSTYNKCIEDKIEFTTDIRYSNFDFMSYPDIYSFFDNALENALEACNLIVDSDVKKYILLSIYKKESLLFVQIENSCSIDAKPARCGFITSKSDSKNHGYGTKNIYKVANKYQANLSFESNGYYKMTCIFTNISNQNTHNNYDVQKATTPL